jgi:hypothetical protein
MRRPHPSPPLNLLTPQSLAGQLPWEGSLCWKEKAVYIHEHCLGIAVDGKSHSTEEEAQAYDPHCTSILESLGIQVVEGVDYRLGRVCSQIRTILMRPKQAPLKGSCPVGTEGSDYSLSKNESALPKIERQGGDSRKPKGKSLIILLATLLFLSGPPAFAQKTSGQVVLTLDPPVRQLLPFEAEAEQQRPPPRFRFEAQDSQGKVLSRVRMQIKMVTPKTNPWISTDFPIVEGTELLSLDVPAAQGVVEFEQMLPIRGAYQVFVNVLPMQDTSAVPLIEQVLTVYVPENPVKFRNFAILAGICVLVGVLGGAFIGKSGGTEILPEPMRLLLIGLTLTAMAALIFVNVSAESQGGHADMSGMANSVSPVSAPAQDRERELNLDGVKEARVGTAESFQAKLTDRRTGQLIPSAFEVSVINTEKNWKLFSIATPVDNQMRWRQQFFDGSAHRIEVQTPPYKGRPALITKSSVSVEGIAPPLFVRLKALAYLTGFVALGLFGTIGLKLRSARTGVSS